MHGLRSFPNIPERAFMRYIFFIALIMMFSVPVVYAEDNWYNFIEPYRLNIGLSNDQTWLYTSLDRDLHYYEGSSQTSDQTSEDAKKGKK